MIPDLEGLNLMSYGDKVVLFIPSNLAYGERSWWRYTTKRNPDFEMEMLENQQVQNNKSF
jgi:FKBP-type peptidyl-prolyl cis-trans isomerase